MKKLISYPETQQFRQTIRAVSDRVQFVDKEKGYDRTIKLPIIKFRGTVKLHGTNSGVCFNTKTGDMWAQSRENIITIEKDNAGFAFFVESKKEVFKHMFSTIKTDADIISIYGEWCGQSIQKGVALSQLPNKMFVVFGVKLSNVVENETEGKWLKEFDASYFNDLKEHNIYNILSFKTYEIDIDFENPHIAQKKMIEYVEEVETQCPVGKAFGVEGVGEGIVWETYLGDNRIIFKTKGEKHSSSRVTTLSAVDVEKMEGIKEFVEYAVTENRLMQGISIVFANEPPVVEKTGDFLRWVVNDVMKEEMDTLIKNNLEPKSVNGHISKEARRWFHEYLDKEAGVVDTDNGQEEC